MSLLMDTQTNRFWARVDFLATGEIVLHIPEEVGLPIRVLVSRGGRSTEYEPNNSEKPNNSTISKKEQVEDEPQIEVCDRPQKDCENCWKELHCRAKDEPQTYVINPQEPTNDDKCFECDDFFTCGGQCNKIEDEPQTERSE